MVNCEKIVLVALESRLHGSPRNYSTVCGSGVGRSSSWETAEEVMAKRQTKRSQKRREQRDTAIAPWPDWFGCLSDAHAATNRRHGVGVQFKLIRILARSVAALKDDNVRIF